jgi:RNA polymerase sigma-70 factor, ECF subfamily
MPTDKELLEMLRKDDPLAMQMIFHQHHQTLCLVAYRLVRDTDQAKDIVQDVFVKFWRNRNSFILNSSLASYLKKATVNTSINVLKSKPVLGKMAIDHPDVPAPSSNTTENEMNHQELVKKTNEAIASLPERTRLVFMLVRSQELTYNEVAENLLISTKAVEKEMMRALRLLREKLKIYLSNLLILMVLSQSL